MGLEFVCCPLCGSNASRHLFDAVDHTYGNLGRWSIVRCAECGLGYQNPRIPPQEIGRYYPESYYPHSVRQGGIRRFGTYAAMRVIHPPHQNASLLDVGCGSGAFVALCIERGWLAEGFDVDPRAGQDARQAGARVVNAENLSAARYPDAYFDAVTMWDCLEHMPDPMEQLREARRILKPEGRLYIGVPDLDSWPSRFFKENWHHVDAPVHYTYWSTRALERAAQKLSLRAEFRIPRATACTRLSALHAGHKIAPRLLAPAWKLFDKLVKGGHVVATLRRAQ